MENPAEPLASAAGTVALRGVSAATGVSLDSLSTALGQQNHDSGAAVEQGEVAASLCFHRRLSREPSPPHPSDLAQRASKRFISAATAVLSRVFLKWYQGTAAPTLIPPLPLNEQGFEALQTGLLTLPPLSVDQKGQEGTRTCEEGNACGKETPIQRQSPFGRERSSSRLKRTLPHSPVREEVSVQPPPLESSVCGGRSPPSQSTHAESCRNFRAPPSPPSALPSPPDVSESRGVLPQGGGREAACECLFCEAFGQSERTASVEDDDYEFLRKSPTEALLLRFEHQNLRRLVSELQRRLHRLLLSEVRLRLETHLRVEGNKFVQIRRRQSPRPPAEASGSPLVERERRRRTGLLSEKSSPISPSSFSRSEKIPSPSKPRPSAKRPRLSRERLPSPEPPASLGSRDSSAATFFSSLQPQGRLREEASCAERPPQGLDAPLAFSLNDEEASLGCVSLPPPAPSCLQENGAAPSTGGSCFAVGLETHQQPPPHRTRRESPVVFGETELRSSTGKDPPLATVPPRLPKPPRRRVSQSGERGERGGSGLFGARRGGRAFQVCFNCGVRQTPQWRYVDGASVCNACYMRRRKQLRGTPSFAESLGADKEERSPPLHPLDLAADRASFSSPRNDDSSANGADAARTAAFQEESLLNSAERMRHRIRSEQEKLQTQLHVHRENQRLFSPQTAAAANPEQL